VARLLCQNVRLREENQALREQAIWSRGNAHYDKRMHRKALERLKEKDGQVEALQSKVCELKHRLFGRKTERSKAAKSDLGLIGPKLKRGQQHGAVGHGRKIREKLPVLEVEVLPPAGQIFCAHCNKPWVLLGEPEASEAIEWEVRLFRKRTKRLKCGNGGQNESPLVAMGRGDEHDAVLYPLAFEIERGAQGILRLKPSAPGSRRKPSAANISRGRSVRSSSGSMRKENSKP